MKKILALLLGALLMCQFVTAYAEPLKTEPIKYENSYEYLDFLENFGFSELRLSDNAPLSRLDFAKALALLIGFDVERDIYTESPFSDVAYYDDGGYEIAFLKEKGILKGTSQGVFNKSENVTVTQAAIMLVRAIGYDIEYESSGTEMTESFRIANSLDITKGVKDNKDGSVNFSEIKKMFFNALVAEGVEIDSVTFNNGSEPEYTYKKTGITFAETLYGLKPVFGIVTKTDVADLSETGTVINKGRAFINGVMYLDENSKMRDFIGQNVVAFADTDDKIKYAYPYKNNFTEIDFTLFPEISNFSVLYDGKNEKRVKLKLDNDFSLLINGVSGKISDVDFMGKDGKVTLIDNDNDDICDVLSITEYSYMLVNSKNLANLVFSDSANNTTIKLDEDFVCSDVYVLSGKDKRKISPAEIEAGAFLKYSASADMGYICVYVIDNRISGTVSAKGDDFINIDGTEYLYSEKMKAKFSSLSIGGTYNFYADENNKLIFVTAESSDYVYGFVMAAKKNDKKVDKLLNIKLMDINGNISTLNLADRVVIDGVSKTAEQAESVFVNPANSNTYCQLIRYKTDTEGKLKSIDTCEDSQGADFSEKTDYDNLLVRNYKGIKPTLGSSYPFCYSKEFVPAASTKIFVAPSAASGVAGMAPCGDEQFEIMSVSDIIYNLAIGLNSNNYKYDVFNVKENGMPDVLVMYRDFTGMYAINEQTNYGLVTDVIKLYDEKSGDVETEISYYYNGEFYKHITDKNITMPIPKKGDIIRFVLINEKIKNISIVFDGASFTDNQYYNDRYSIRRLRHKNFSDGVLRADVIAPDGTEIYDRFYDLRNVRFVEFNTKTKESFSISSDVVMANGIDYASYKDIFVVVFNYSHQICILYK